MNVLALSVNSLDFRVLFNSSASRSYRREQIPFTMAIGNVELMHEGFTESRNRDFKRVV